MNTQPRQTRLAAHTGALLAVMLAASTVLSACGGGGGGDQPPGGGDATMEATITPGPTLLHVPTGNINLRTSKPLDKSTVGPSSFNVRVAATGDVLEAALSFPSSAHARLTPANGLALNAVHEIRAADTIRGLNGETFAGAVTSFTTADGNWLNYAAGKIVSRTNGAGPNVMPIAGTDASGNAIALYARASGGQQLVFANHLSASANEWGTVEKPIAASAEPIIEYKLAVNARGAALALWTQRRSAAEPVYDVWSASSHTTTPGVWSDPVRVNAGETDTDGLQLVIDAAGDAMAQWRQRTTGDNGMLTVQAARFSGEARTWGAPKSMRNGYDHGLPQLAGDGAGSFVSVWTDSPARIGMSFYRADAPEWAEPSILISAPVGSTLEKPRLAMNEKGALVVAYLQRAEGSNTAWAVTGSFSAGLQESKPIKASTPEAEQSLEVAIDAAGNAVAAWNILHRPHPSYGVVYFNRLSAATGEWGTAMPASPTHAGGAIHPDAVAPMVRMDKVGNVMLGWTTARSTTTWDDWYRRYDARTGEWDMARQFSQGSTQPGNFAIDRVKGHVLRVWPLALGDNQPILSDWFR